MLKDIQIRKCSAGLRFNKTNSNNWAHRAENLETKCLKASKRSAQAMFGKALNFQNSCKHDRKDSGQEVLRRCSSFGKHVQKHWFQDMLNKSQTQQEFTFLKASGLLSDAQKCFQTNGELNWKIDLRAFC